MRIGVLGTGMVGRTLGHGLLRLEHEVRMGSRRAGGEAASAWVEEAGAGASEGDFADAASFGELVVNATAGTASLQALEAAGAEALSGKVLLDVANPIAQGSGMPPALEFCNTDSLAERIQRAFPEVRVVKSLNTMNASVMTDPGRVPGSHSVFVCGEDDAAKDTVAGLLSGLGWPEEAIVDLGGIEAARGTEMYLALWLRLFGALGTADFNIAVVGR